MLDNSSDALVLKEKREKERNELIQLDMLSMNFNVRLQRKCKWYWLNGSSSNVNWTWHVCIGREDKLWQILLAGIWQWEQVLSDFTSITGEVWSELFITGDDRF